MYQSQFCYPHRMGTRKHFTFSPILEAENITTSEKEAFPPELLKFAEQLSSAGKTVYDVFSEMDLNEDGTLDVSEFREGLAALEKNLWWTEEFEIDALPPYLIDSLVDEFDRSGDGKISLGEFDALVRRIPGYVLQESDDLRNPETTIVWAVLLTSIWLFVLGDYTGILLDASFEFPEPFGFVCCLCLIWPALAVLAVTQGSNYRLTRVEPIEPIEPH